MFKDLIQTFGLPITSFTVSGDIKQKSSENIFKKNSKNDQFTGHFQSLFIYFFSSPLPPTLNLNKNSRKSTKKNSGLNTHVN